MELLLNTLAETFYSPIHLLSSERELIYTTKKVRDDVILPEESDFSRIRDVLCREEKLSYVLFQNSYFLSWIIVPYRESLIISGPVVPENFNYDYFSKVIEKLHLTPYFRRNKIKGYNSLPKMSVDRLKVMGRLITLTVVNTNSDREIPVNEIILTPESDLNGLISINPPAFSFWEYATSVGLLESMVKIIKHLKLEEFEKMYKEQGKLFEYLGDTVDSSIKHSKYYLKSVEFSLMSMQSILCYFLVENGIPTLDIYEHVNKFAFKMSGLSVDTDVTELCKQFTQDYLKLLESSKVPVYDFRINKVLDYIMIHYDENISLEDVSSIVGMEVKNLSKLFKKEMGIGFKKYIEEKKINRVINLLKYSNLSLLDIALSVGFQDQAYFTRWFKQKRGITPGEFRSSSI